MINLRSTSGSLMRHGFTSSYTILRAHSQLHFFEACHTFDSTPPLSKTSPRQYAVSRDQLIPHPRYGTCLTHTYNFIIAPGLPQTVIFSYIGVLSRGCLSRDHDWVYTGSVRARRSNQIKSNQITECSILLLSSLRISEN